jgi:hypothetical protein
VIERTHPEPKDAAQSALFRYLLDRRHHGDESADPAVLPVLASASALAAVEPEQRRAVLRERGGRSLAEAGFSWERLSGWLPGGMDAEAWQAVIPSMGAMALLRNLRNFDEARIDQRSVEEVIHRITDPAEVARARLFPHQVWAAYREAPSDDWKRALATTLELTLPNVPVLDGTLVLVDTSGSMGGALSARSTVRRVEVAAVMAMALAKRARDVDVVIFGQHSGRLGGLGAMSALGAVSKVVGSVGSVGHATFGHSALAAHFVPGRHRRAVIVTDDQMHDSGRVSLDHVPLIYTVNLAGYRPSALPSGGRGRYSMGGFSDATFEVMHALEAGQDADWPF